MYTSPASSYTSPASSYISPASSYISPASSYTSPASSFLTEKTEADFAFCQISNVWLDSQSLGSIKSHHRMWEQIFFLYQIIYFLDLDLIMVKMLCLCTRRTVSKSYEAWKRKKRVVNRMNSTQYLSSSRSAAKQMSKFRGSSSCLISVHKRSSIFKHSVYYSENIINDQITSQVFFFFPQSCSRLWHCLKNQWFVEYFLGKQRNQAKKLGKLYVPK